MNKAAKYTCAKSGHLTSLPCFPWEIGLNEAATARELAPLSAFMEPRPEGSGRSLPVAAPRGAIRARIAGFRICSLPRCGGGLGWGEHYQPVVPSLLTPPVVRLTH